jgi:phenylalanyl-tRNA synthetase beta chain|tara:strand:+ start:4317 stop:6689 length:2373 start_codon:yes stop_codon:yes gene_type:complete
MIVSIKWLKEFVEINETPKELADMLSSIGLEAEFSDSFDGLGGVIVGKVKSVKKHPNADRLNVCRVYDGKDEHQVVCGAKNVAKGQTIAYAKVGSVLPGDFQLERIKLRGVESNGMICSAKELNIHDDHEGIIVLPDDCEIGKDFIEEYGSKFLKLELDITPNRPDAFSHYGVARDIAVYTKRKLSKPEIKPKDLINSSTVKISIEDVNDCPRYVGGLVHNVTVGPSPRWMQDSLISSGQRPINNLVDISNYVLMELGQPTHIFDYDSLKSKEIHIRRGKKNESITTLDQNKFKLNKQHLLITDGKDPVALAGIMGGLESSVSEKTKSIFIESAFFNPVTIRKSSKSLSFITEASKRFERGADHEMALEAFWRTVKLIEQFTGGIFEGDFEDYYPEKITIKSIVLRKNELELVLGIEIENEYIISILTGLGFSVTENSNSFECVPPSFRPDISREIDVIEEVARIYGYDNIPIDNALYGTYSFEQSDAQAWLESIRNTLSGLGFNQIYSNSLQNKRVANLHNENSVPMLNPLSNDMAFLRTSLLPGLVKATEYNIKNSSDSLKLFELGNVHSRSSKKIEDINENIRLAGIMVGNENHKSVHSEEELYNIYSLKGDVQALLKEKLNYDISITEAENDLYDQCYNILSGKLILGTFGKLSKNIFYLLKIDKYDIYAFDIDIDKIEDNRQLVKYSPINFLPKIARRINLVMNNLDSVMPILGLINKKGGNNLIDVYPVEVFEDKKNIGENKKSVTFEMIFQDTEKTLEDKDVNPIIDEIIDIAENDFNAKLRV